MPSDIKMFDKKVRTILIRNRIVELHQLDELVMEAKREKKSMANLIVDKSLIDEKRLLSLLAQEMKIPPITLDKIKPDPGLIEEIPKELAENNKFVPISKVGNIITVAVQDPSDVVKLDSLKLLTKSEIRPVLTIEKTIKETLEKFYSKGANQEVMNEFISSLDDDIGRVDEVKTKEDKDDDISNITEADSPIVKLVNVVVYQAVKGKASDIHIEPYEKYIRVRYRHDGVLKEVMRPPKKYINAISSRLKIMCGLDIAERGRPQDGKFRRRIDTRHVDFRVSILPMVHGEKTVLRILDTSSLSLSLASLGFEERTLNDFRSAITSPYGMVLVTGPTGSGKSTTLYSSLKEVVTVENNVVTVEDPVEYQLDGVNQVPVNPRRGLDFADALRSILRQDPDIVMIGEIRDKTTIGIAIKAALTGHLVFSTLHTNDAPSTITRIVDMGVDPFMVASSVLLVAAQRLGRKLCKCKLPTEYPNEHLLEIGYLPEEIEAATFFKADSCMACNKGYAGRFALLETLVVTEAIKRVIIDGGSAMDIKSKALEEEMITLRRCGLLNAMRGRTSVEEILRLTLND